MTTEPTDDWAFPHNHFPYQQGMTLRDYFAAQALLGLLGAAKTWRTGQEAVEQAWIMAGAMLEEREK